MTNPIQERNDAPGGDGNAATPAPQAATTQRPRQAALHRCPNCGAINRSHASICPECGENLRTKPRQIRCRQCGKRTSSVLVLCPHCGRELVEAPARWVLWGIPALLVLLFLILLASRWNSLEPVTWLGAQVDAGWQLLDDLSVSMDPNVAGESTLVAGADEAPVEDNYPEGGETTLVAVVEEQPADPPVELVDPPPAADDAPAVADDPGLEPSDTPTPEPTATEAPPTPTETPPPTATETIEPTATEAPATATSTSTRVPDTPTTVAPTTVAPTTVAPTTVAPTTVALALLLPTLTPTRQVTPPTIAALTQPVRAASTRVATATATPVPTATDTPLPTPTDTPLPTATPTATETPEPTPTPIPLRTHRVQAGDTLSAIGARYGVSIDAIMAANNLTAQDVYRLRPGDELVIPDGRAVAADVAPATAIPAPTTPPRTYTVQAGDTPIAIANRLGVTVDALLAANNLTLDDARRLRTGQVFVVPGSGQPAAAASAAPVNPVAPSTDQQAIRLEAPRLRSPENGAQISCGGASNMAWLAVEFMGPGDQFLLHLGFVSGIGGDGRETITWVLEQVQAANNTLWAMDTSLCGLAPQQFGRKWYWYVEVIDTANTTRVRVSPPSDVWSFSWN